MRKESCHESPSDVGERACLTGAPSATHRRDRTRARSRVQAFVYLTATELGLSGSVVNDSAGVVIEAEGSEADSSSSRRRLLVDAPPLATVEGIEVSELRTGVDAGFTIRESSHSGERPNPRVTGCRDLSRVSRGARRSRGPALSPSVHHLYQTAGRVSRSFSIFPTTADYDDGRIPDV